MTFRCPTVWSTELCASVPRTVLVLLIETAKTSRLCSLPNPFRVAFFSTLQCIIYTESRNSDTPLSRSTTDHFFFLFSFLTPPRGTKRHCFLGPRPISLLFLFFNTTLWHRATPLSRSSTDPFFFNATPWHRAILLSRSATDFSLFYLTPPRGTERHRSLGPRPIPFFFQRHPVAQSDTAR